MILLLSGTTVNGINIIVVEKGREDKKKTNMATRKRVQNHCVMGNNSFRCLNCGGTQILPMPITVDMFGAMAKQFEKSHKNCPKTWSAPVNEVDGKTEEQNANWWLTNGERGVSSETMFGYLSGNKIRSLERECHPLDQDDFRRCHLLLEAVPQWREKLYLLKPVSPVWSNLVDNWDRLTEMLKEQIRMRKYNGMYEFMKELGC